MRNGSESMFAHCPHVVPGEHGDVLYCGQCDEAVNPHADDSEVAFTCGRCKQPAKGHASINGTRYCHEGESPTCYELASRDVAFEDGCPHGYDWGSCRFGCKREAALPTKVDEAVADMEQRRAKLIEAGSCPDCGGSGYLTNDMGDGIPCVPCSGSGSYHEAVLADGGRWRWSNKGGVLVLYADDENRVVLRTQPQAGTDYDLTEADAETIANAPTLERERDELLAEADRLAADRSILRNLIGRSVEWIDLAWTRHDDLAAKELLRDIRQVLAMMEDTTNE